MRRLVPLNPAVRCIGVASALGAPFAGAERGPEVMFAAGLAARLIHEGLACHVDAPFGERHLQLGTEGAHMCRIVRAVGAQSVVEMGGFEN